MAREASNGRKGLAFLIGVIYTLLTFPIFYSIKVILDDEGP